MVASLIAIPILVYVVGQDARAAQATALVIVVVGAISGLGSYLRAGEVRWRAGLTFGLAAGVSALAGSLLNRQLDQNILLLAFSPVMVAGAIATVSGRAGADADFRPWKYGVEINEVLRVLGLGLAVGWLIGLFGVGGGFLIVPALVVVMHLAMTEAVGTSLLVIMIGSLFALVERLSSGDVDWGDRRSVLDRGAARRAGRTAPRLPGRRRDPAQGLLRLDRGCRRLHGVRLDSLALSRASRGDRLAVGADRAVQVACRAVIPLGGQHG